MDNIKRVVSVGAHPLDAELIGGPLIIKYSKLGAKCTFMHVTQGRLEDSNATKEENDAYIKDLINQNISVAKAMNADCVPLGYSSKALPKEDEFAKILADYFNKEKVDLVLTHHSRTMHPRHY